MDRHVYAIGDIHGRDDLLEGIVAEIDEDCLERGIASPLLVFLGDYIDRGPHARQVLDRLIRLESERDCRILKGNHEEVVLQILDGLDVALQPWLTRAGGIETVRSYGWESGPVLLGKLIPQSHVQFLRRLLPIWETEACVFVHAGLRPERTIEQQSQRDLLWIREGFLDSDFDFGKLIVHGHTPTDDALPEIRTNRLNLDTDAHASGVLTCAAFEPGSRAPRFLRTGNDRKPAIRR